MHEHLAAHQATQQRRDDDRQRAVIAQVTAANDMISEQSAMIKNMKSLLDQYQARLSPATTPPQLPVPPLTTLLSPTSSGNNMNIAIQPAHLPDDAAPSRPLAAAHRRIRDLNNQLAAATKSKETTAALLVIERTARARVQHELNDAKKQMATLQHNTATPSRDDDRHQLSLR
jgi:hypothetical protein